MMLGRALVASSAKPYTFWIILNNQTSTKDKSMGSNQKNIKRRVSFATKAAMYFVPPTSCYDHEQICSMWWTKEERSLSQKELVQTVKDMRKNKNPESDNTYRGLEHFQSTHRNKYLTNSRACLVNAVLELQEQKVDDGDGIVNDDTVTEKIAIESMRQSQRSKEEAFMLGKCDEAIARRLHTKNNDNSMSTNAYTQVCKGNAEHRDHKLKTELKRALSA